MLKPETFRLLLQFQRRLVAAVRCDAIEFVEQGTRSERVVLQTSVLSIGSGPSENHLIFTRWTQGDPLMKKGKCYLVGAYGSDEWWPTWVLEEATEITKSAAEEVARESARALASKTSRIESP